MADIGAKDVLEVGADVVTWALVVLGWMIVSDQQESREIAKTGYSRISSVREMFRDIERHAVAFHTQAFDQEVMHSLMRQIDRASREMTQLRKHSFIGLGTSQEVGEVRKAITGKNFDRSSHRALDAGSPILIEIEAACSKLDRELQDSAHRITAAPRRLIESIGAIFRRKMV